MLLLVYNTGGSDTFLLLYSYDTYMHYPINPLKLLLYKDKPLTISTNQIGCSQTISVFLMLWMETRKE